MKKSMIIHPDELSKKWIDRASDAGIDTIGIHSVGGREASVALETLVETLKTKEYRDLIDYAHFRGLRIEYELHTAGYLLPREMFSDHPDYFRMNESGERVSDWNFCVSNTEALDLVAKRAAELAISLYGSEPNFYFWMDDRRDSCCHCPKCRKLSPSDQQLIVINRMLKEIKKYIPDARMAYLAYMDTILPPTSVVADGGVFLEYAPFEKYTAKGENADKLIEREKEMLIPLMRFFDSSPRKVLEYWYDNSLFSKWKKPPAKFYLDEKQMRVDITEYIEQGFDYISTFACFLGKDYEDLYGEVDISAFSDILK